MVFSWFSRSSVIVGGYYDLESIWIWKVARKCKTSRIRLEKSCRQVRHGGEKALSARVKVLSERVNAAFRREDCPTNRWIVYWIK